MFRFSLVCVVITAVNAAVVSEPEFGPLKNGGVHWGVIVAGSQGWSNYRHQADACHAYHVLKNHGVKEENIIVMMYDDIAHNEENPTKGIIINHPKGKDVYGGVKIDYKGRHVTPKNFLNVLTGKKSEMVGKGTGRVLESGPNDHVFVNFVDHGGVGIIAFPDGELHARQLNTAIKTMHKQNMYAQMVIYIEACESGSMLRHLLPDDINVYATTASNAHESSYACYHDAKRGVYLGDVYSVKWMENSDASNLGMETLAQQFALVKKETNTSHVQEYGDLSIAKEAVSDFQGSDESVESIHLPEVTFDAVPSPDVELIIIRKKISQEENEEKRAELNKKLTTEQLYRQMVSTEMEYIVAFATSDEPDQADAILNIRTEEINYDCYELTLTHYSNTCRKINANAYALRQLYVLQNLCNAKSISLTRIYSAMDKACMQ